VNLMDGMVDSWQPRGSLDFSVVVVFPQNMRRIACSTTS
jgi:hypothetical protein